MDISFRWAMERIRQSFDRQGFMRTLGASSRIGRAEP